MRTCKSEKRPNFGPSSRDRLMDSTTLDQANQLWASSDYNVAVLYHSKNPQRQHFSTFATSGLGQEFLEATDGVMKSLFQKFITTRLSEMEHTDMTGAPSRVEDDIEEIQDSTKKNEQQLVSGRAYTFLTDEGKLCGWGDIVDVPSADLPPGHCAINLKGIMEGRMKLPPGVNEDTIKNGLTVSWPIDSVVVAFYNKVTKLM